MRGRGIAVASMAVAALTAGCTGGTPGTPSTDVPASQSPTTSPSQATYQVWFAHGEFLFVTERTQPSTPRIATAAVDALLTGPTGLERGAGVATTVPDGTELLGFSIEGGIATANLSSTYASGGGSLSMSLRLAQLTYTLTRFPTVRGVNLELEGEPTRVFSGEGIVLDQPMTRRSYRDLLPPILVVSPVILAA